MIIKTMETREKREAAPESVLMTEEILALIERDADPEVEAATDRATETFSRGLETKDPQEEVNGHRAEEPGQ